MDPNSYCAYVANKPPSDLHRQYHDREYGFPLKSDEELFGRLLMEINQAGLSWTVILQKKDNFRKAYSGFNIEKVANYGEEDWARLLNDAGIIRNKLKIGAAIYNAQQILKLQKDYGSFQHWLNENRGLRKPEWVKLFKKTFKFTGGEITGEFLMSTGYLEGAHDPACPIFNKIESIGK